jgi:hypothetical protein
MWANFISLAAKEQNVMEMKAVVIWEENSSVVTIPLAERGCC